WLLDSVGKQLCQWREQGDPTLKIILRMNEWMIREPSLISLLSDLLEQYRISADTLGLDVSDTVVVNADGTTLTAINALCGIGVQLGITLSGASLSYLIKLKRIPLRSLGMSPSFMRELTQDPEDPAALIALAS